MVDLRLDSWSPEYGTSQDFDPGEEPTADVELDIETGKVAEISWERPVAPPAPREPELVAVIDGTRRVHARLFAEDRGTAAPALAGSWAVGVAYAGAQPTPLPRRPGEMAQGILVLTFPDYHVQGRAPVAPFVFVKPGPTLLTLGATAFRGGPRGPVFGSEEALQKAHYWRITRQPEPAPRLPPTQKTASVLRILEEAGVVTLPETSGEPPLGPGDADE